MAYQDSHAPIPWWRRARVRYAFAAFLLGVVYTAAAVALGLEIRLGARDLTLVVGSLIEVSFAAFGFLIGLTVEARRREQQAACEVQAQLEALAAAQVRLAQQEKLASLGQLAGTVAHEVRNPLAILRSMVQNLSETLSTDATIPSDAKVGRETCSMMLEEIDRLAHVTSTIVGFARPLPMTRRTVGAASVVAHVRLLVRPLLADRDIRLELATPADPDLRLEADPDLLCQVLLGLLENAAAASPTGSTIELGWHCAGDNVVEITVTDHGEGIPRALRERIFEPFFTTRSQGSGLGLAVARQIIEAHGGTIAVDEAPDRGARFHIRLPSARPGLLSSAA